MAEAYFSVVWGEQFALVSDTPYQILDSGSRVVETRPHRLLVLLLERFTTILSYDLLPFTDFAVSLHLADEEGRWRVFRYTLISDTCSCLYHANTAVDARQTFVRWLNDVLQSNWTENMIAS